MRFLGPGSSSASPQGIWGCCGVGLARRDRQWVPAGGAGSLSQHSPASQEPQVFSELTWHHPTSPEHATETPDHHLSPKSSTGPSARIPQHHLSISYITQAAQDKPEHHSAPSQHGQMSPPVTQHGPATPSSGMDSLQEDLSSFGWFFLPFAAALAEEPRRKWRKSTWR